MAIVFSNNARTTLASNISNSATTITVADGSVFPSLTGGDIFYCTIDDGTNNEIVEVTAISSNTLTVTRGQDNTTARAFVSGDLIELRLVAKVLETFPQVDAGEVTADEFIGDLRGAVIFKAEAGEAVSKGDVVYVSGISGNTPVVALADADFTSKMPAFGLVLTAASANGSTEVVTFGTISGLDTSSFSVGDTLYVSTTAGALTNSKPTGEASLIQNIGMVQRSHATAGSIKVGGAGRTATTPNLNDGNIFIGNASNQATTASLNTKIEDYLDANGLTLPDTIKAQFGTGNDLQIYHDGSHSYIDEQGTGRLYIRATSHITFQNAAGTKTYANFSDGGVVGLRYNNATKLQTSSTGIDVTGTVVSDGLTVAGNTTFNTGDVLFTGASANILFDQSANALEFADNAKAQFGTSNDLQIYHDGADSYVQDNGTGNLNIKSNGTFINFLDGSNNLMAYMVPSGAVGLYHNGSNKLITTSDGIATQNGADIDMDASGSGQIKIDGNGYGGAIALGSTTMAIYHNSSSRSLTLGTNETARIIIGGSGGVNFNSNDLTSVGTISSGDISITKDGNASISLQDTGHSIGASSLTLENGGRDLRMTVPQDIIFDTGSEVMRIDNDERVLIGKSSAENASVGFRFDSATGFSSFVRDGGEPLYLNRKTSDGTIQKFAKDDSLVGEIGTVGGDIYIAGLDANHAALRLAANSKAVLPVTNTGALSDNTTDLGQSNAQFKDLYLGGTITSGDITSSGNLFTSGYVTIDSTTDGKLRLMTPSGESSDWNYIEFYGADDTRDGYVGTDADGDMKFFSDKNSSELRLESSGATISTNLTVTGDLTVNGTTTTVNQTNLDVSDNLIGLNRGASSNANDSGMLIERGSTGDNVFIGWDESTDKITFATTTNVPSDTGNLTLTAAPIQASSIGVTNIVTNKVVKYNGSILDDSNITDTGSLITLGSDSSIASGSLYADAGDNWVGINTTSNIGTVLNVLDVDGESVTLRLHTSTNSHQPVFRMNAKNSSGTQQYADIKYNPDSPSLNFHVPYNESTPTLKVADGSITVDGTATTSGTISYNPDVGGDLTLGNDGSYGTHTNGRYLTLGFGGTTNGYNRIFAGNTADANLFIASATGRGIYFRTNGGSADSVIIDTTAGIKSRGQVRATGWYGSQSTDNNGTAAEIGAVGTNTYVIGYDRTNTTYRRLYVEGAGLTLDGHSGTVLFNDASYVSADSDIRAADSRVRIGNPSNLSGRSGIRIDTTGDSAADLLFGDNTGSTGWTNVNWSLSSRATNENQVFRIYRGSGQPSPYNSEAVAVEIARDLNMTLGKGLVLGSSSTLSIPSHSGIEIDITGSTAGNIRANQDFYLLSQNGTLNLGAGGTNSQISLATNGNATFSGLADFDSGITVSVSGSDRLSITGGDVNVVGATDLQIAGNSRRLSFTSGTGTVRTTTSNSLILQTNSTTALTLDSSQNSTFAGTVDTPKVNTNELVRSNSRVDSGEDYPVGHYSKGDQVFAIDPTWSQSELQSFFNSTNVTWSAQSDAPGGYAVYINGAVNVGGVYGSGFGYIPIETGDLFYMECWIKNVGTNNHYMGSNEFNEGFTSVGGNPGSFGYWVMSNTNPGTSWVKVSGYISNVSGTGTTTGQFDIGAKYWTPQALFNYANSSGTRACYISGWKVYRVNRGSPLWVIQSNRQDVTAADTISSYSGSVGGGWTPMVLADNNSKPGHPLVIKNSRSDYWSVGLDTHSYGMYLKAHSANTRAAFLAINSSSADMHDLGFDGDAFHAGNVGIGVAPDSAHSLKISSDDNEPLEITGSSGGAWINIQSNGSLQWSMGADSTGWGLYDRSNSAYRMQYSSGNGLMIREKLRLGALVNPEFELDFGNGLTSDESPTAKHIRFPTRNGPGDNSGTTSSGGIKWESEYSGYTKESASIKGIAQGNYFRTGIGFFVGNDQNATTNATAKMVLHDTGQLSLNKGQDQTALNAGGFGTPQIVMKQYVNSTWGGINIEANGNDSVFAIGNADDRHIIAGSYRATAGYKDLEFAMGGNGNQLVLKTDGDVCIGQSAASYSQNDNTRLVGSTTSNKLHVNGSVQLTSNNDAFVIGNSAATFLSDEELGFGWGGGWYMTDGTYLRVRNNKTVYSTGTAEFGNFTANSSSGFYTHGSGITIDGSGSDSGERRYVAPGYNVGTATTYQDIRVVGTQAVDHKYTRDTSGNYGYKMEYWWDGNSYQSIRQENDAFRFSVDVIAFDTSDKRLKNNITPIENCLDKVSKLGAYEFEWDETKQRRFKGFDTGVIAQEVEEVYPHMVETREDGYKALQYEKLVPLLLGAIKEQQEQIESLKSEVDNLKGEK